MSTPTHLITIARPEDMDKAIQGRFMHGSPFERVALAGRSNVGKSTLINKLLETKLAQVSKTPGKTKLLHCYEWRDAKRILVDLPGYGFAKVSHTEKDRWAELIEAYFRRDPMLTRVFVLLDARVAPTVLDLQLLEFLSSLGKPVTLVVTKSDQLKNQSERARRKRELEQKLVDQGYGAYSRFWVSSFSDEGIHQLRKEFL